MPSVYLHPEFGYFCPSPGLRRVLRVALAFAVIGVLAGASGVVALVHDQDPNLDSVAMTAPAEARSVDPEPTASRSPVVKAEASPIVGAQPDKSAAKSDSVTSDAAKSETGTADKIDAITGAATTSCEENTWAYLDGRCGSGKVRKMRVVRTAPAISRTSPFASVVASVVPVASAPAGRNGAPSKSSPPESSPSKSKQAPSAEASVARTLGPSQQPVVAARKPQTAASSQSRRRDQAASSAPSLREVRPAPTGPLAFGPFGPGGFFSLFR